MVAEVGMTINNVFVHIGRYRCTKKRQQPHPAHCAHCTVTMTDSGQDSHSSLSRVESATDSGLATEIW